MMMMEHTMKLPTQQHPAPHDASQTTYLTGDLFDATFEYRHCHLHPRMHVQSDYEKVYHDVL